MRRAVAFFLTVAAPGTGHLLLGRRGRAVAWILGSQALIVTWAVLLVAAPIASVAFVAAIVLAVLAALIDVLVVARTAAVPRWFVVGAAVIALLGVVNLEREVLRRYVTRAYSVPTGSMRPALEPGDYFLADKTAYRRGSPRRGDIIVFPFPRDPHRTFVMRVVGLPGERVAFRGRAVLVNGSPISEPYLPPATAEPPQCPYAFGCPESLVPADSYFVMGDSRDTAYDSRYWGFVPRRTIVGRASVIYWSVDPADDSLRLNRIATSLRRT